MYNQGDIVVVKFPFSDGSVFKKSPALVISKNKINKLGDVLLVQITSKFHWDSFSVSIEDSDTDKPLPLKSYVRIHKIFTIHEGLILSKFNEVSPEFSSKVANEIFQKIKSGK